MKMLNFFVEKSPAMRRTIQWRSEGYDHVPGLYRIRACPVLFLTRALEEDMTKAFGLPHEAGIVLTVACFALVHENGKFYSFDAPNVQGSSFVCMGDMKWMIEERIVTGEPPNIPELFWNSVFTSRHDPNYFTWDRREHSIDITIPEAMAALAAAVENG